MKKLILSIAVVAVLLGTTSCGTLFGGHIGECQKTKSPKGMPGRQVRGWVLVFDGPVGLIIDACTGGLYMPCDGAKK
jgi:hypothetical protein